MKKLQSKVITLSIAMILIGNLQAMSPTMRQLVQERGMARKWKEAEAERMADPSLRIKNIYQRLGLPRGWDKEKLTAPTIIPLMELFDDDEIVEIIQNWRNEGHLFPDERFHVGSVSNAIVKYGANLFRIPLSDVDRYLFQNEPTYQIGGKEYPESAIYAMTPKERGSLLLTASTYNDLDALKKLIEWGANLNLTNNGGDTPLIIAALHNNTRAVRALLNASANVNIQNKGGVTALMWAAASDNTEALRALLEAGADPNIQPDPHKDTALIVAAKKNNAEAVRALLSAQGIDPNIQNKLGETALIWATIWNNTAVVQALLNKGSDPNLSDNKNRTALIEAAFEYNTEALRTLLQDPNIDPSIQDTDGSTALMWAAASDNIDAVRALLEAGARTDLTNNSGDTVFDAARENPNIINLLRQHGATE